MTKFKLDGTPKKSGRPRKVDTTLTKFVKSTDDDLIGGADDLDTTDAGELDSSNWNAGISLTGLAQIFKMAVPTVRKRLSNCPIKGRRRNVAVYDLYTAAQYLVPPKVDISAYIKGMSPSDLPPLLQSAYWDAMKKKQSWEKDAGLLWPTESVIEVFGETFKLIKNAVNLWSDDLEQKSTLTEQHRKDLQEMSDGLLKEVYDSLVTQAALRHTPNQHAQLAVMEEEQAKLTPSAGLVIDEDDDLV